MELMDYMFLPDEEIWHGYPKAQPDHQTYGESFDELQLKLLHLHLGPSRSTISPPWSNTTLLAGAGNDTILVNRTEG